MLLNFDVLIYLSKFLNVIDKESLNKTCKIMNERMKNHYNREKKEAIEYYKIKYSGYEKFRLLKNYSFIARITMDKKNSYLINLIDYISVKEYDEYEPLDKKSIVEALTNNVNTQINQLYKK